MLDGVVVDPADRVEAPPLLHGPHPPPLRRVRIEHQHILRGRPARAAEPTTCECSFRSRAANDPSAAIGFYNHGESPY